MSSFDISWSDRTLTHAAGGKMDFSCLDVVAVQVQVLLRLDDVGAKLGNHLLTNQQISYPCEKRQAPRISFPKRQSLRVYASLCVFTPVAPSRGMVQMLSR